MKMQHTIPPVVTKTDPFILAMRSTDRWVAAAIEAGKDGDQAAVRRAMAAWEAPSVLEAALRPMTNAGTMTKVWRAIDLLDAFSLGNAYHFDWASRRYLKQAYVRLLRDDRRGAVAPLRAGIAELRREDGPRCIRYHAEGALAVLDPDADRTPTLEDLLS